MGAWKNESNSGDSGSSGDRPFLEGVGREKPAAREIVKDHLYFWHIKNRGIAYNRFSGRRKGILLATGALLAFYGGLLVRILRGKGEKRLALPLALTLGGGAANFWERLRKGRVTDFLFIPVKGKNAPIFNIADVSIVVGALWMTVIPFLKNKKK